MSTSSLRLCVWRIGATALGYSPRRTMAAAASWEKCRTRRLGLAETRVVIVIVTWVVLSLSHSALALSLSFFLSWLHERAAFWSLRRAPFCRRCCCCCLCFAARFACIWNSFGSTCASLKCFASNNLGPELRLRWVACFGHTLFAYVRLFALNCRKLLQAPWLRVYAVVCVVLGWESVQLKKHCIWHRLCIHLKCSVSATGQQQLLQRAGDAQWSAKIENYTKKYALKSGQGKLWMYKNNIIYK